MHMSQVQYIQLACKLNINIIWCKYLSSRCLLYVNKYFTFVEHNQMIMMHINNTKFILFLLCFFLVIVSCEKESPQTKYQIGDLDKVLNDKLTTNQIDSLFQIVNSSKINKKKIDLLLNIYKKSIKNRPIRHDILDTALYKAKIIDYKLGIGMAYDKKGLNSRYSLRYLESVNYHKKALIYFKQTIDTFRTIKCLNSLGVSLRRLNLEKEALNYYLEALALSRAIKNERSEAISLNGIGNIFVNIEQYDKAMPYFKEALGIEMKNDNPRGIKYDLNNIGECFMFQQKYDSALFYYHEALVYAKKLKRRDNTSILYNCIGQLYQLKEDYLKSNEYYSLAIPKLDKFDGKRYLSNTYINLGKNYDLLGDHQSALYYIEKGINLALEINSPENILIGHDALYKHYEQNKKFDLALMNYQKSIQLRDSIKGEETKRNIAALETIYENSRKENEIKKYQYREKLYHQQDTIKWLIIVFLLLLAVAIFILLQYRKKNNRLVVEQMRIDIEEYLVQIKELQSSSEDEENNEKDIFHKNVEKFGLSVREIDVLLLISEGLKNDEIAEKLFLSVSTIKTHTRNVFIKLDVRNRIEASRKAQNI